MRVAIKAVKHWAFSEIVNDFKKRTRHEIVDFSNADVTWLLNPFPYFGEEFDRTPSSAAVVIHIHHLLQTEKKKYINKIKRFNIVDACVVPNKITEEGVKKMLTIPIYRVPYWILSKKMGDKNEDKIAQLRKQLSPNNEMLIGSFIHDNPNRFSINQGTDDFFEIVCRLKPLLNIKVILSGIDRGYLTERLEEQKIPCLNLGLYPDINSLYDCLDWYFVNAKVAGGPQSILEASYRKVNILSTRVGIAPEILHPDCICETIEDFVSKVMGRLDRREYNFNAVSEYTPEKMIPKWDVFFETLVKNKRK